MFIRSACIYVSDQKKALAFYTEKLGFVKRKDYPVEENRFLTIASALEENPMELALEAINSEECKAFQEYLFKNKKPAHSFEVSDLVQVYVELKEKNVDFPLPPADLESVWVAILDDTCGNLIELYENRVKK